MDFIYFYYKSIISAGSFLYPLYAAIAIMWIPIVIVWMSIIAIKRWKVGCDYWMYYYAVLLIPFAFNLIAMFVSQHEDFFFKIEFFLITLLSILGQFRIFFIENIRKQDWILNLTIICSWFFTYCCHLTVNLFAGC